MRGSRPVTSPSAQSTGAIPAEGPASGGASVPGEIITLDGLRLKTWARPAPSPRANLLVVHGLKDYGTRYAALAETLVSRGISVFGYDLRGHGRSEGPIAFVEDFTRHTSDLGAAMAAFESAGGDRPWFVFGHSMGGGIVARAMIDSPARFSGFLLSAPALAPTPDVGAALIAITKLIASVFPRAEVLDLPNAHFSRDPSVVASLSSDPLVHDRKVPARTAREILANMDYVTANLAKVSIPFLVLHGALDRITNPEGSKAFFRGTRDLPGKSIAIYEGLVHDLLHEPEKGRVEADIAAWLEARLATR